jgi:hypothetical protein
LSPLHSLQAPSCNENAPPQSAQVHFLRSCSKNVEMPCSLAI